MMRNCELNVAGHFTLIAAVEEKCHTKRVCEEVTLILGDKNPTWYCLPFCH